MQKVQKTYTSEFKREAVRLAQTSGKPIAQVARELGMREEVEQLDSAFEAHHISVTAYDQCRRVDRVNRFVGDVFEVAHTVTRLVEKRLRIFRLWRYLVICFTQRSRHRVWPRGFH